MSAPDLARVPASLADIEADWLSAQLRAGGLDGAAVAAVTLEPIGGFSGITGQIGRLRVEWADGATGRPATFVAKAPNTDELSRTYNATMRFYARESGFYADLADQVAIPKPKVYVNAYDPVGDTNLLVLEDLAPAVTGDVTAGTDFDTALELLGLLARIHGTFWLDGSLADREWLWSWNRPEFVAGAQMLTPDGWQRFTEREPDFFPPDVEEVVQRRYLRDVQGWVEVMDARPFTFCHGDYEVDNVLFRDDGPWVVDWQMCLRACPGSDLAFFLASSCHNLVDRERELLDAYRELFAAAGGPHWGHDERIDDLAHGLMFWVAGQPLLCTSDTSVYGEHGPRMDRRFRTFLEGTRDAAVRWDMAAMLA
jgi:hypothetical protein